MRKLALFSAAFAAAAAVFVYLLHDIRALWIAGVCLVLSPVCFKWGIRRFSVVFLGLAAGFLWCFGYQNLWLSPVAKLYGTEQTMTVILQESPEPTAYGCRANAKITVDDRAYEAVFYGDEALLEANIGDHVTGVVEIESAGMQIQDGESLYHRSSGTVVVLLAKSECTVEDAAPQWSARIRQKLQDRIHLLYADQEAGFLLALLTGDRSGLPYSVQNELAVAGLSHAVAVSGMHVSILMALVAFCCGGQPRITAAIGIPLVVVFVLMTGASPSACRAGVMQVLLLLAPMVRREQDTITNLAAAALVLLLQNPWVIASVSFQLSFAAVIGMIVLGKPLQVRLMALKKQPGRLWRYASAGISASLSVTIATMPLVILYFEMVSLAALLVNLLSLWAVTLVFSLGLVSCFVGALGSLLALPVGWMVRYILWLCRLVSRIPYAAAYPQNFPLMIWAILAYGAGVMLLLVKKRKVIPVLICLTAGFLACTLWGNYNLTHGTPVFRVLDVGQGQATIWNSDGFTAVLDCGGSDPEEAGEQIARTLYSGGQTHVDAVIITHYDLDHAGGVPQLLNRVRVGQLLLPDVEDDSGMRRQLEAAAQEAGCPVYFVAEQTELEFSGGKLTVYPPVSRENDNNSGICILASAAGYDMLMTGDLDQFLEMRLISSWDLPQVDLLVAGHHGAADSTAAILLETVQPQAVAVSVGTDNAYGHPSAETLDRIKAVGAEIYRTDLQGTLVFR